MKTTRAKLAKFLEQHNVVDASLVNKLIESGFVEIQEEQREFWIIYGDEITTCLVYSSEKEALEKQISVDPNKEVTIVKQFVPIDQCKKYEKMWEELKNNIGCYREDARFDPFMIVNMMNKLEKGK